MGEVCCKPGNGTILRGSNRGREALELDCSVSDKVTGFGQYLKAVGQVDKMVKGLNQDEGLGSFTN